MGKLRNILLRLFGAALFAAVLGIWLFLDLGCGFRRLTGWICPMCGMTRAAQALLKLDLAAAFYYHPMFWCVPVFVAYLLLDPEPLNGTRKNYRIPAILLAGFLICYAVRLTCFLCGTLPL